MANMEKMRPGPCQVRFSLTRDDMNGAVIPPHNDTIWEMKKEKCTTKGARAYSYWMASWRDSGRVRHIYIGSCRKISREVAMQKARKMKAQALDLKEK